MEGSHWNVKLLNVTFWPFFSKYTFLKLHHFISPSTYPINSFFFSGSLYLRRFMFLIKHISSEQLLIWQLKNCLFTISMTTIVREINSFIKIMRLINPNYPWKVESSRQRLLTKKCLCYCIFCTTLLRPVLLS